MCLRVKWKMWIFTWAFCYCLRTVRLQHISLLSIDAHGVLMRQAADQYRIGFIIAVHGWHNNHHITAANIMLHGIIVNVLRWNWTAFAIDAITKEMWLHCVCVKMDSKWNDRVNDWEDKMLLSVCFCFVMQRIRFETFSHFYGECMYNAHIMYM